MFRDRDRVDIILYTLQIRCQREQNYIERSWGGGIIFQMEDVGVVRLLELNYSFSKIWCNLKKHKIS